MPTTKSKISSIKAIRLGVFFRNLRQTLVVRPVGSWAGSESWMIGSVMVKDLVGPDAGVDHSIKDIGNQIAQKHEYCTNRKGNHDYGHVPFQHGLIH